MKKLSLTAITLFLFACAKAGGWELTFCERDSAGVCLGESESFYWGEGQTRVFAMVKNENGLLGMKLQFKVFETQGSESSDIYADLKTYTRPEWTSVSRRISFIKPGYYKVEVYDERQHRLASRFVTITDRPE